MRLSSFPSRMVAGLAGTFVFLFIGSSAGMANNTALCREGLDWSSATFVRVSSDEAQGSVSIQRYRNGIRIDLRHRGRERFLIMLESGERLFGGAAAGSEDFTAADLAAAAPLHFLRQKFAAPCDASQVSSFALTMGAGDLPSGGAGRVHGIIRADRDALDYTLLIDDAGTAGGKRTIEGRWSVAALEPVPLETAITGWSLQRKNGAPIERITVATIRELLARLRDEAD